MPTPEDLKQEAAEKEREAEERDDKVQRANERIDDLRGEQDGAVREQPAEHDKLDGEGDGNKFSSS